MTDTARAEKALEPLALGARLAQRRIEETAGWWVYIAPQGNRQTAAKKALELKNIGIEDYFVVLEEGRWRWAISLGVFKSEEAANSRLAMLRAKGVRTALLGQRDTQVQKSAVPGARRRRRSRRAARGTGAGIPGERAERLSGARRARAQRLKASV